MDFQSDRAKTQHRQRGHHEETQPESSQLPAMMTNYQRILVTSRNSKSRHGANSGIAGIMGSDLALGMQNCSAIAQVDNDVFAGNPLNMTHDQIAAVEGNSLNDSGFARLGLNITEICESHQTKTQNQPH